jgi:MoxR-like ATPase
MTPIELKTFLNEMVRQNVMMSTMIWGAPGIGKSSIVAQIAKEHNLGLIDVRLSQLAPTDLRGLPVAENGVSKWYPPEFLPTEGAGILFLDELNMSPPAMQGMAQQLILDRKVGSYEVPKDWFIWAAGNRKEDRAAVFDMPSPLANRFLHLEVHTHFEAFKEYALLQGLHEQILAFLAFRPELLHKMDTQRPNWPSPRSWEMASRLHKIHLSIEPAIGEAVGAEFNAFTSLYQNLPDLKAIMEGKGDKIKFPKEPSVRYATTIGLIVRANEAEKALHAFQWLSEKASTEWVQFFWQDLAKKMRAEGKIGVLAIMAQKSPQIQALLKDFMEIISG